MTILSAVWCAICIYLLVSLVVPVIKALDIGVDSWDKDTLYPKTFKTILVKADVFDKNGNIYEYKTSRPYRDWIAHKIKREGK